MKISALKIINVDNKLARGRAITNPVKLRRMKKQENITTIIDLRNSYSISKMFERIFCCFLGINYKNCKYQHRLNVVPAKDFFEHINEIVLNNPNRTYIHCEYGKRRTGIAAAYYEKTQLNKSSEEIMNNLMEYGYSDVFQPNAPKRLKKYAEILDDFSKKFLDKH